MYVHIPFCKTLCHYCGCNRTIQKNKSVNRPYLELLKKEFDLYKQQIPNMEITTLNGIHFGGGTPTFLSAEELSEFVDYIKDAVCFSKDHFEGAIEVDPRTTSRQQLQALYDRGFNRVSLGVQDFNEKVQKLINRTQGYDVTKNITDMARAIGYTSVNFDLIYGLPGQGLAEIRNTIEKTISLKPDRIALYSLAIVPWFSPAQRNFKDSDLPDADLKRELYETARERLTEAGYEDIGMDHFALNTDSLYKAKHHKSLHRNFMGYTDQNYQVLLGLGVSSISETPNMYFQNSKELETYKELIESGLLPFFNGHTLTGAEKAVKQQILQLTTQYQVKLTDEQINQSLAALKPYRDDNLCTIENNELQITKQGEPFLRNICSKIDPFILGKKKPQRQFSKSI